MKLTFIGTGEAFDTDRANSSYLIEKSHNTTLVDSGYTAPQSLRRLLKEQGRSILEVPGNILLTHFHGDHFAGLSAFLIPLWDNVRETKSPRGLIIASADKNIKGKVENRIKEDYPGLYEKFKSDGLNIDYKIINPEGDSLGGLRVSAVVTSHSVQNYAYRFENGADSLAISGDGALSESSKQLYIGVDLLIHEGFFVDKQTLTHASIKDVADYAVSARIHRVAIVHVNQAERERKSEIEKIVKEAESKGVDIFFPDDGETYGLD